ncbi:MAG: L-aspartate oxidase, partial [Alphaproteobacteria bacterium]|nr:L-aspartate oxidase [Alphaproteobacteria bacterium]
EATEVRTRILPAAAAPILPDAALSGLRMAMSAEAGVVRDAAGLSRLIDLMDELEGAYGLCADLTAARLTACCALNRKESLGAHFRLDAPEAPAEPRRTFITLGPNGAAGACLAAE